MPYQILVIDDNREHLQENSKTAERAVAETDKTGVIEVKGVDSVPAMQRAIAAHSGNTVKIIAASTDNIMYGNPKAAENARVLRDAGIKNVAVSSDDDSEEITPDLKAAGLEDIPIISKGDPGALQKFFADAIRKTLSTA